MKWFWNVSVQFAKYVLKKKQNHYITLNISHHDNRQSNVTYTDKLEIVNLRTISLDEPIFINRWTTLVHATIRISYIVDKWNSWLADVTFDWRHAMETAIEQTSRFIFFFFDVYVASLPNLIYTE